MEAQYSGSALDYFPTGRAIDPSPGAWRDMIDNESHLISPGCPRTTLALQVQNRGLKHHSFQLL